jgi:thiamine pyrophosphokinase
MTAPAGGPGLRAVILAGGGGPSRADLDEWWPGWAEEVGLVIAADAGASLAGPLGLHLDRWVGDADSVDPRLLDRLAAEGVPIDRVRGDKDETDTELALLAAIQAGASDVTIIGGLGGPRLDHALANVALLAHPALAGRAARVYGAAGERVSLLVAADDAPAVGRYAGRSGDLVSLIPLLGPAGGVRTEGLRYPLRDESLPLGPARGISNVRLGDLARIQLRAGRLLVIETPASLIE